MNSFFLNGREVQNRKSILCMYRTKIRYFLFWTSRLLRKNEFTSGSLRAHFGFTSGSLHVHFARDSLWSQKRDRRARDTNKTIKKLPSTMTATAASSNHPRHERRFFPAIGHDQCIGVRARDRKQVQISYFSVPFMVSW